MPIRNRIKVGDYLLVDDESGFVHYASEMKQIWNQTFRHHTQFETRQPQEFVRSRIDPKALRDIRPRPEDAKALSVQSQTIGATSVTHNPGPASHLYAGPVAGGGGGIGTMKIGTTFLVT